MPTTQNNIKDGLVLMKANKRTEFVNYNISSFLVLMTLYTYQFYTRSFGGTGKCLNVYLLSIASNFLVRYVIR